MKNKTGYGKCKECGAEAVHLATSAGRGFFGDQDDNRDAPSEYAGVLIEVEACVGIHACFACGWLEDIWVESPQEKDIERLEAQNRALVAAAQMSQPEDEDTKLLDWLESQIKRCFGSCAWCQALGDVHLHRKSIREALRAAIEEAER